MKVFSRPPAIVAAFELNALQSAQTEAVELVNAAVGRARLPHVTDIPGQQAIYAEKAAEARAYVAMDPAPETLAEFPLLAAEVAITAPDAWQLSQVWLNMQAQLRQVGAQSEKLRLGALRAIRTAGTVAELDGILAAFPLSLTDVAPPRKRERLTQNTTF